MLRWIWGLPGLALGLLVAALVGADLVSGPGPARIYSAGRGLGRLLRRWGWVATTIGPCVFFWEPTRRFDEGTLSHELAHVEQWARWGPLFLPLYLLAFARALVGELVRLRFRGAWLRAYRAIPFEAEARARAGEGA